MTDFVRPGDVWLSRVRFHGRFLDTIGDEESHRGHLLLERFLYERLVLRRKLSDDMPQDFIVA